MEDFGVNEMQEMQRRLQDKYRDRWEPVSPETGGNKLLWMIGEIGEVIDIVKKHGGPRASADPALREALANGRAALLRERGGRRRGADTQVRPSSSSIDRTPYRGGPVCPPFSVALTSPEAGSSPP